MLLLLCIPKKYQTAYLSTVSMIWRTPSGMSTWNDRFQRPKPLLPELTYWRVDGLSVVGSNLELWRPRCWTPLIRRLRCRKNFLKILGWKWCVHVSSKTSCCHHPSSIIAATTGTTTLPVSPNDAPRTTLLPPIVKLLNHSWEEEPDSRQEETSKLKNLLKAERQKIGPSKTHLNSFFWRLDTSCHFVSFKTQSPPTTKSTITRVLW